MARKKKVEEHVDLDALVQGLPTTDEVHEAHARSRTNLWRDPQFVAEHLTGQCMQTLYLVQVVMMKLRLNTFLNTVSNSLNLRQ